MSASLAISDENQGGKERNTGIPIPIPMYIGIGIGTVGVGARIATYVGIAPAKKGFPWAWVREGILAPAN